MKSKHKAFTLAELMIIMAVMTVLFAAIAPIFTARTSSSTSDFVWHWVPASKSGRDDAYSSHKNIYVAGEYFFGLTPSKSSDVNFAYAPYSKVVINASDNLQGKQGVKEDTADYDIAKGDMQNQMEFLAYHENNFGGSSKINQERVVASIFAGNRNMIIGGNIDGFRANPDYMNPKGLTDNENGKLTKYTFADNTSFGNKTFGCSTQSYEGCMYSPPYFMYNQARISYVTPVVGGTAMNEDQYQESQSKNFKYSGLAFGGMGNTALGYFAAAKKVLGRYNVAVGYGANWFHYGQYQDEQHTIIGYESGPFLGLQNTLVGNYSFPRYNSSTNTVVGNNVGDYFCKPNQAQEYDTILGINSFKFGLTPRNTGVGAYTMNSLDMPSNKSYSTSKITKGILDFTVDDAHLGNYSSSRIYDEFYARGLGSGSDPCYDHVRRYVAELYYKRNSDIISRDPYASVLHPTYYRNAYDGVLSYTKDNATLPTSVEPKKSIATYNRDDFAKTVEDAKSHRALSYSLKGYNTAIGYNAGAGVRVGTYKTCVGAYSCPATTFEDSEQRVPSIYTNHPNRKLVNVLNDVVERVFIGGRPNTAGLASLNLDPEGNNPYNIPITEAYEDYDPVAVLELHNLTTSHRNPYYHFGNAIDNVYQPDMSVVINGNLIVRGQSYLEGRQRKRFKYLHGSSRSDASFLNMHPYSFANVQQPSALYRYVTYKFDGTRIGFAGFDGVAGENGQTHDATTSTSYHLYGTTDNSNVAGDKDINSGVSYLYNCSALGDYLCGGLTINGSTHRNPLLMYRRYINFTDSKDYIFFCGGRPQPDVQVDGISNIYLHGWNSSYDSNYFTTGWAIDAFDLNYANMMNGNNYSTSGSTPYQVGNTCFPQLEIYPTAISDARLKNIDSPYNLGLEKINKLNVYNYTFKSDESNSPQVGVIAQDLKRVFPAAVMKNLKGFYHIRWDEMFYSAINAVKELNTKVEKLASRVQSDMERISALKKDNADMEKKLDELAKELDELEK